MGIVAAYPPSHNSTYVKATTYYSSTYYPWFATDPTLPLTGAWNYNAWFAGSGIVAWQKFNIDIGSANILERIYLENIHYSGAYTSRGIRNFWVYGTNSSTAFANTTYSDTTNLTLLGTFEAQPHVASNVSDPQYFTVDAQGVPYRYYVFRILDNWGDTSYMGIRHIELQVDDGHGSGSLVLKPLTINAIGTHGRLSLQPLTASGEGRGTGTLSLQPLTATGKGGGKALLSLDNITISASGRTTTLINVGSTIPYIIEGGFDLNFHTMVDVAGTIPYVIVGGFQMDRTEIGGTIPYEITGGFDIHSEILIGLSGIIPYTITGGFDVSPHIPVSLVGNIPYVLTGGFAVVSGVSDIDIEGTIPYTVTGGFGINSRVAMEVEGTIPYIIEGGIGIDSGASSTCGGVMQYAEDTIC